MSGYQSFTSTGTFADFGVVLGINAAIFAGVLLAFQLLRSYSRLKYFYAPKLYDESAQEENLPNTKIWFGWIKDTLLMTDRRLFELRGLDAVMHVSFLRVMVFLFLTLLPISAAIIATNATGDQGVQGVQRLSLANVAKGSPRMWAHVVCGYAFTILTLFWLYKGYRIFEYFSELENMKDSAHNYAIVVRNIPKNTDVRTALGPYARSRDPECIEAGASSSTLDSIVSEHWALKENKIRKLQKKKHKLIKKQHYLHLQQQETGEVPHKKVGKLWQRQEVDAIAENERKQQDLQASITTRRNHIPAPTRTAFVVYQTVADAKQMVFQQHVSCRTASHIHAIHVEPAPYINDVLWKSLHVGNVERGARTLAASALIGLLLFFWAIPVGFVQVLANLNNLGKVIPFLRTTDSWSAGARGFVQGLLPPIILVVFFALLPKILRALNRIRAPTTYSRLDAHVTASYYAFQVINVFLVSALAGGIFNILAQLKDKPNASTVANLLGSTIPAQSIFFVNLLITYAFFHYPLQVLRIGEMLISRLKVYFSKTQAEARFKEQPSERRYSTLYGVELLVFTIAITYTFTAPFIIPWAILFFALAYLFAKYDAIYVTVPVYPGRGKQWHTAFNCCVSGLILAHVILVAVLILKGFPEGAVIIPMPVLTIFFTIWCKWRFALRCEVLSEEMLGQAPRQGHKFADAFIDPAGDPRRDLVENELLLGSLVEEGCSPSHGSSEM